MIFNISDEYKNRSGIYLIRNLVNNKIYIGSSKNFKNRFNQHISSFKRGKQNSYFQNAFNKYGTDHFQMEILSLYDDINHIHKIETLYIKIYDTTNKNIGYNFHDSIGHTYRAEASEETKEKLRNINLGKKLSEEHKQKISASHKGKKLTPEHCKKISEVQRGKKQSSTSIEKRIISRKKFYEENPDKIPKMSKETKEKLKKCNLGHKTNEKQRNALALGRTKKGEDVSHSILTEKEVIEIKHHLLNKSMSVINMGKLYNVSIAAIYDIKQGRTWKHVL